MVNKTHKRLRNIVLLAIALGLAAGVGVATGSIPGSDGVIHGCYNKVGGGLRVIDTGTTSGCNRSETRAELESDRAAGVFGAARADWAGGRERHQRHERHQWGKWLRGGHRVERVHHG